MYEIDNKFEIGEECFSVYKKPIHYLCPICEGNGKFMHNGYEVWCRKCSGSGKLHDAHKSVMAACKVRVRRIIASIFNGAITIKYKVDGVDEVYGKINNRSQSNLFKTVDEAMQYCKDVNDKSIKAEF